MPLTGTDVAAIHVCHEDARITGSKVEERRAPRKRCQPALPGTTANLRCAKRHRAHARRRKEHRQLLGEQPSARVPPQLPGSCQRPLASPTAAPGRAQAVDQPSQRPEKFSATLSTTTCTRPDVVRRRPSAETPAPAARLAGARASSPWKGGVKATKGHYHDAIVNKKLRVVLFLVEALGGICGRARRQCYALAERASGAGATDRTKYGKTRASPSSFYVHHTQQISKAAVMFDAAAIRKAIVSERQKLCMAAEAATGERA